MKRLLAALSFLVLLFLIWFFWSMQDLKKIPIEDVSVEAPAEDIEENKTLKFKPEKKEVKISLDDSNIDVEVSSDDNGLFITKIDGKKINKRVSDHPVQRLAVHNGIMSFWEINTETESLKYRSLNLNALVDRLEN